MTETTMSATKPQPTRTLAERALIEAFVQSASHLPGNGWVDGVRRSSAKWLETYGLPTRRIEAFKYTDLRERLKEVWPPAPARAGGAVTVAQLEAALGTMAALDGPRLVFVDGVYSPDLSRLDGLGDAVEQMPLAPLLRKAPSWLAGKFEDGRLGEINALTTINTAFMSDGLMIKIKPGQRVETPVHLVSLRAGSEPSTIAMRNVVAMEPGSSVTLVETHVALAGAAPKGLLSALTDVTVADGASLSHICCALDEVSQLSSTVAKVGAHAEYRLFQLTAGPKLARSDIFVDLEGKDSKLDISGAFLARGTSHLDTTLVVDHKAPGCESRELFKGVLADRARGVFQGKIIVRPGADQTDGKQMARALLLSDDTEFDSKPELEIYADDVACGHGATAAALDEDLMFYCLSRGIPEAEASGLLIEAFIGEAVEKIESDAVRAPVMETARRWLAMGDGT